jgi:hypothetical protein
VDFLGLLAEARHTHRYKNLKDFVKRGETRAVVEVPEAVIYKCSKRIS